MSLLGGNDLKEQQKINELELKINREKQKLDKKLTRQKILLGAFLVEMLEKDSVEGLKEYTADNLLNFLTRQTDKDLMADLVKGLVGRIDTEANDEAKLRSSSSEPYIAN
ncbi:MAG: mobilization protein MobS [Psychrobacter sp.]